MNACELFRYVVDALQERGWGRALRTTVASWYSREPAAHVAADMLKCDGHDGYTHRDLLRLAHPKPVSATHGALFQWASEGRLGHLATPILVAGELRQVYAVDRLRAIKDEQDAVSVVERFDLTFEMIPAPWRASAAIWEVLLPGLSYSELLASLDAITRSGLLDHEGAATALVVARLIDRRRAANSRASVQDVARARDAYARHPRANRLVLYALDSAVQGLLVR